MNMSRDLSSTEIHEQIRILLVEDDYILALNFQEILESLGYTVVDIANSAEVAIEKAHQIRPDLILMDIQLSGKMNGIEGAEKIWNNLQIPSIYVTGYAYKDTLERATQMYPFDYLLKPVTKQEINATIQKILGKSL
jgi:CheY-like chemotaxis protein